MSEAVAAAAAAGDGDDDDELMMACGSACSARDVYGSANSSVG